MANKMTSSGVSSDNNYIAFLTLGYSFFVLGIIFLANGNDVWVAFFGPGVVFLSVGFSNYQTTKKGNLENKDHLKNTSLDKSSLDTDYKKQSDENKAGKNLKVRKKEENN